MRFIFLLGILIFTLSLFSGCGGGGGASPTPSDNNPPPPPYNIYGYVKDTTGHIIQGATVSACYKDEPQTILASTSTDSQGKYYLWVPWSSPDRIYLLTASKEGYKTSIKEITLAAPDSIQQELFTLDKE